MNNGSDTKIDNVSHKCAKKLRKKQKGVLCNSKDPNLSDAITLDNIGICAPEECVDAVNKSTGGDLKKARSNPYSFSNVLIKGEEANDIRNRKSQSGNVDSDVENDSSLNGDNATSILTTDEEALFKPAPTNASYEDDIDEGEMGVFGNVFSSSYNLIATLSALTIDRMLDVVLYTVIGQPSMTGTSKKEIIASLNQKYNDTKLLLNDKEGQKAIQKVAYIMTRMLGFAVASIGKPLLETQKELMELFTEITSNAIDTGSELFKNVVRAIPGVGTAYILLDNLVSMSTSAAKMGKSVSKVLTMAEQSSKNKNNSSENSNDQIKNQYTFLRESMHDFNQIKDKIRKNVSDNGGNLNGLDQTVQKIKGMAVASAQNVTKPIADKMDNYTNQMKRNRNSEKQEMRRQVGGKQSAGKGYFTKHNHTKKNKKNKSIISKPKNRKSKRNTKKKVRFKI